jgi:malonyl-CoA decarboxylase
MNGNFVSRSLDRVKSMVSRKDGPQVLSDKDQLRVLQQLQDCAEGTGGEVSARQRAARLAQTYRKLDDAGKAAMLRLIATEFGPDPARVAKAHAAFQAAIGSDRQWDAEAGLRAAMRSRRTRILTQFTAMPEGVKFLVDLRTELLRFLDHDPALKALDRELEARLSAWFDVGFLELARMTWSSPALLLEKLIAYEAVHEIRSWTDLKNRLDSDRRCYGFFHPRMPMEPLIFVEVALVDALADNVQALLDEHAPVFDAERAETAIFYSISNTQTGLRGVSFGNFLLKRVIDDLMRDFPKLKTFATLSPLPGLVRWAAGNPDALAESFTAADWKRLAAQGISGPEAPLLGDLLRGEHAWSQDAPLATALREPLSRVAARYLLEARKNDGPLDPVARFHLGNGARVERLNWLADTSSKGLLQSWGLMVNYLYDPDDIERNVEAFAQSGRIAASTPIRRLGRR